MQNKNYINNEWVDASDGQTFAVENPYTEAVSYTHLRAHET